MDSAPEQSGWAEVGLKASSLLGQDFITTWMPVKSTTRVSSALPGSTSSFKNIIAPVIDFVHNKWVIGGGIALVAVAAGVLSFAAYMDHSSASQIDKVQAENRRLFSEIDKLSRDNELLLEGNHRAAQLNQEVRQCWPLSSILFSPFCSKTAIVSSPQAILHCLYYRLEP
jgi:hypothetical protein